MCRSHPALIADGAAAGRHARQLPRAALANLDPAVLPPAVVAEGVAALHHRRLVGLNIAEAGAAGRLNCAIA